jgi:hypothetical protein
MSDGPAFLRILSLFAASDRKLNGRKKAQDAQTRAVRFEPFFSVPTRPAGSARRHPGQAMTGIPGLIDGIDGAVSDQSGRQNVETEASRGPGIAGHLCLRHSRLEFYDISRQSDHVRATPLGTLKPEIAASWKKESKIVSCIGVSLLLLWGVLMFALAAAVKK